MAEELRATRSSLWQRGRTEVVKKAGLVTSGSANDVPVSYSQIVEEFAQAGQTRRAGQEYLRISREAK